MGLDSLEERLQRTVEGVFSRNARLRVRPIEIGRRLLSEMDHNREVDVKGRRLVPNVFKIKMSPADHQSFAEVQAALSAELAEAARHYAKDEGYYLPGEIEIAFVGDESLKNGRFQIEASTKQVTAAQATWVEDQPAVVTSPAVTPVSSYLVLENGEKLRITERTLTIGRQSDCDVTLVDSNVSRKHAEVRMMPDGPTMTDLGSTNGTKINDVKISGSQVLVNGDVISIGAAQVRVEIS